jgi:hypothetical protein
MKSPVLVLIEWEDSSAGIGWQSAEEIKATLKPAYCRSVGWLVSENKTCKTIVPHLSGQKDGAIFFHGRGDLVIPTKSIVKTTPIKLR